MRVAITSRIFDPEPSAAAFRLEALARAFVDAGHDVEVLTVRPPRGLATGDGARPYRVRRWPVLRDAAGYVRGYTQYMSFDIPLFFRILLGPKRDLIVTEPPPTTGFFVRLAAALRRTPYVYYAADVWADAAAQTGAPAWMVGAVRWLERRAWTGAKVLLSVSAGVTERLAELGFERTVVEIGNGVDVARFSRGIEAVAPSTPAVPGPSDDAGPAGGGGGASAVVGGGASGAAGGGASGVGVAGGVHAGEAPGDPDGPAPAFVYAGTASEWHGARIFVEAYARARERLAGIPVRFIGGGSERDALEQLAASLGIADTVQFSEALPAEQLAPVLGGSVAALASLKPGSGYDFAFPTKLYSAAACGAPLIHVGGGPADAFVRTELDGAPLGEGLAYDADEVAAAMVRSAEAFRAGNDAARRARVREWAAEHVDLGAVARRAVAEIARRDPRQR